MTEQPDSGQDGDRGGREVEVKFRTDAAGLKQVLASSFFAPPAAVSSETLSTVYFDTAAGDLRRREIALRIRRRGRGRPVLGLKARGGATDGPFSRTEIEVASRGPKPDLALFDADTAAQLAHLVGERPLEAQFATRVRRRTVLVAQGRSQIELACDDGGIVAGERHAALSEVELELKAGEEGDLCDLALALAEKFPLRLDFASKAERGFRLATGESAPVARAAPIVHADGATLDDAVVTLLSGTLAQFVGNWAALRTTGEPEAVHQARVALRRLRAALKLFRRALPCPQFEALGDEARRIASAFGPTRDCDAFLETAAAGPLAQADQPAGCEALQAWVEGRRAAAFGDVRALVEDLGTTRFVLDLRSLLARRAWRNALDGAELARLTGPAEEFAQATLDRLHAKALKRGKKLAGMPDAARHELRITLKTLRYGAEFFGALFGGRRRVGRYVETVSALQDLLGAHNDAAGARRLLDETPPDTERASGFVLGWFARGSTLAEAELAAAWKRFRKADLFWR